MNKNEFPTMEDGSFEFVGFDIHPVLIVGRDDTGADILETCDDTPEFATMWSVYGILEWGGSECVADCPNRVIAEMVLRGLEVTHHTPCPECGSDTNYVDASDGCWRICNDCGANFEVKIPNNRF